MPLTALQAFELMYPKAGETVFISGGTGSLGAMAIPVAKSLGLTVITNGNGSSEERVRKLGADRFIDYKNIRRKIMQKSFRMWITCWILLATGNWRRSSGY